MFAKLVSAAVFSTVLGLTLAAPQAEARRLFWWEAVPPENGGGYDIYGGGQDVQDGQDVYAQDLFNQEQYDLYMQEMNHRRHRRIYDQSYYDPQLDNPDIPMPHGPKHKVLKYKKPAKAAATTKPVAPTTNAVAVKTPLNSQVVATAPKPAIAAPKQTGVETITANAPGQSASINCGKGASIVSSYGFSSVATKDCSGKTFVYSASRSGKNFEIQVSSTNGELTAVKKL